MARLITCGFEYNDLANGNVTNHPDPFTSVGGVTISSVNPRSGSFHGRSAYVGSSPLDFSTTITSTTGTVYTFRVYVNLSALPEAGTVIRPFGLSTGAAVSISGGWIAVGEDGSIDITTASSLSGSSVKVTAGVWFRLEVQWKIDTAVQANDTIEARVNGVTTAAGIVTNSLGTTLAGRILVGAVSGSTSASTFNIDIDDIALNDSTGASQTSWPGSGKVVLLKPTADSAVGTGWTLGTGTAIAGGSGSTAVKNTPPVGVADLTAGSDTKQIRNATSNANVNYDATMTTYTAAGVGANDTINVVVPIVITGAPVVTSAKAGTVGVVSNPAIPNISLGAGGTAGAFWSGVAAGAYPTGWKISLGTTTYTPSVTKGTAPVMRITQVTASTRIADVCNMGMYVDYTPAATSLVVDSKQRILAHRHHTMDRW